jgi:hypothetical protein
VNKKDLLCLNSKRNKMSTDKTHWKKFFNYDYLGAYSLDDVDGDLIVTIDRAVVEKVIGQNGKKEDCLVCYFSDADKPMILNRTNCKIIEKIYKTPHVQDWKGKRVQLYSKMVAAFGSETDALRIREFEPKSVEQNELGAVKAEALKLYKSYNGTDKNDILAAINKAKSDNTDSVEFYKSQIKLMK